MHLKLIPSISLTPCTGEYSDVLVGTIPESASGVTGSYITALGVTGSHIMASGVTGSYIMASGVTGSHIMASGVTGSHIKASGVTGSHIMASGVTGSHIKASGVTGSHIMASGVTGSHIMASGVTGSHIMALMLQIEMESYEFQLPLIGHCTDSAANSLSGLVKLASPSTYANVCNLTFIGLPLENYVFLGPFIRSTYPSVAYIRAEITQLERF